MKSSSFFHRVINILLAAVILPLNASAGQAGESQSVDHRFVIGTAAHVTWIAHQPNAYIIHSSSGLQPQVALADAETFDCSSIIDIPVSECSSLVSLYKAAGGDTWLHSVGWLDREFACDWYGVTCLDGMVTGLDLAANNLVGELPAELASLEHISILRLDDNPGLTGTLPDFLTGLALEEFRIAGTGLCEPRDEMFQSWLTGIDVVARESVCNQPPTSIRLSESAIAVDAPRGTIIGYFETIDPDGDIPSYSLVTGNGELDNRLFEIANGNELVLIEALDNPGEGVSILVRADDGFGGLLEKAFTIPLLDAEVIPAESDGINLTSLTISVCPSGCEYSSIQAAVNAATSGDTIQVQAGIYSESVTINKNLTISGAGAGSTMIKREGQERVLTVLSPAVVQLSGVTITGGQDTTGYGGGGIFNTGNLSLSLSEVSFSSAQEGGGILSKGVLSIQNSSIHDNTASYSGGGVFNYNGQMHLIDVTVQNNTSDSDGGGVYTYYPSGSGTILDGVTISGNHAPGAGAGIRSYGGPVSVINSNITANISENWGGGLSHVSGQMTINNTVISSNQAYSGGAIHNMDTITLEHCEMIGNQTSGYAGAIDNDGTLTVQDSIVQGNTTTGNYGGGILNDASAVITRTTISDNSGKYGGGIYNWHGATLEITESTLSGNEALYNGGAISGYGATNIDTSTISGNVSGEWGGGIHTESSSTPLTISNSLIQGNTSWIGGGLFLTGPSDVTNVTISGNISHENMYGAGVYNSMPAVSTFANVTITENVSPLAGGIYNNGGTLSLRNSILADNAGGNCSGILQSNGNNVDSDGSCGLSQPSDQSKIDPLLEALEDNGGPSLTHALAPESPAIDRGADCPSTDQRGSARPVDGDNDGNTACDPGAYEAPMATPSSGPLLMDTYFLDDDDTGQSSGNNNGVPDPGEIIELNFRLINVGTVGATNVQGAVSSTDPYASWMDNTSSAFPETPGRSETRVGLDNFELMIGAGAPVGHVIEIAFTMTSSNGGPGMETLALTVGQSAAPTNDHILDAAHVTSIPFHQSTPVFAATSDLNDPVLPCASRQSFHTVWYEFTPDTDGTLTVDASLSDYDTIIGIWSGGPDSLSIVGCNDDNTGLQSGLQVPVLGDETYYVEVASYWALTSGTLDIEIRTQGDEPFIYYVSTSGNDSNSCASPETACASIQSAIDRAADYDVIDIGAGIYQENILIQKDITLQGTGLDATIIDGSLADRVIDIPSASDVVIRNLTVQNGRTVADGDDYGDGAGIRAVGGALQILNVIIQDNQSAASGGGLATSYDTSQLVIRSSTLVRNSAAWEGGGVLSLGTSGTTEIHDSIISENSAQSGGGLMNGGSATITNTVFQENSATDYYGGAIQNGWGAFGGEEASPAVLSITNSQFRSNHARGMGGALNSQEGTFAISGSVFDQNTTTTGSGGAIVARISASDPVPSIHGSCITRNSPFSLDVETYADDLNATGNWWGQPSGPSGNGPGSGDSISQHVNAAGFLKTAIPGCGASSTPRVPPLANPLTPSGTITDYKPAYMWNMVPGAHGYVLNVKNSAGVTVVSERYNAPRVCVVDDTCSVEPSIKLPNGNYRWALKTSNVIGNSVLSAYRTFVVSAPPAMTRYVSAIGDDGNDCLTVPTACATVQAAITKSVQGDIVQILPGIYYGHITVDRDMTILGSGSADTFMDGDNNGIVFTVGAFDVTLADLTIQHGSGSSGGGVFNEGKLVIRNAVITDNSATDTGGGIFNSYDAELRVETSRIFNNQATHDGGGAMLQGKATFSGTEISGNTAVNGGGIYTHGGDIYLLNGSSLNGNTNGGIMNWWSGRITVEDSTIDSNTGYGVYNGGPYAVAGITRSTVSRNTGVGIDNNNSGTVTVLNSTISGNVSNGIETNGGNRVDVASSTLAFNSGNGIYSYDVVNLRNSIIAHNTAGNCNTTAGIYVFSLGNNVDSGNNCHLESASDRPTVDPLLGPLQNNGGLTWTHALDIRSPAVDAGTSCPATDQRKVERPIKASSILACDSGSYELMPTAPTATSLVSPVHNSIVDQILPTLTWSDVTGTSGATRYSLQLKYPNATSKTFVFSAKDICAAGSCSYKPTMPLRNGLYSWRVRSENAAGLAAWTGYWALMISASLPELPTSLSPDGEQLYDPSPTYAWQAAANAVNYQLEVRNGVGRTIILLTYVGTSICKLGGSCSVTPAKLIPASGDYTWRVRAANSTGYGEWTTFTSFADFLSKPGIPSLTHPKGTITVVRASYSWQPVVYAQRYQVLIKDASGRILVNQSTDGNSIRPNLRLKTGKYSWQVRAWNPIGWGTWSPPAFFTPVVAARQDWYVTPGGDDANDCRSISTPCQHIQTVLDRITPDDTIHVAPGNYLENLRIWDDVRMQGDGEAPVIDGNDLDSVIFTCANTGYIELFNLVIRNGSAGFGGGISFGCNDSVLLENSTVTDNRADVRGGGIYNAGGYELTLLNSTISNNYSDGTGGGLELSTGGGKAKVISSTISGNSTSGASGANHIGGGIYSSQPVEIVNSTISGNSAFMGGALCPVYTGDFKITNSTIADNEASYGAGIGASIFCDGTVTVKNTIIAKNRGGFNKSCMGAVISRGGNLEDLNSCGLIAAKDLVNTDPLLGPLQDNGGPTFTHALLPDSPALDSGINTGCPKTDQRGTIRPQDADANTTRICDRGAYERPDALPDKVVLQSPVSNYASNTSSLLLTWTILLDAGAEKTYQVQIARDTYFKNRILLADALTHSFMAGPLDDGKYYWRVRASHNQTWGPWSAYRIFIINTTP